ncbi:MAG: hypothetical protein ACUVUG_00700 [Candidatus Aminicenantia bacterium]
MERGRNFHLPKIFLGSFFFFLLIFLSGCGLLNYTLTVIVEEGVTGTPESGQYKYKELETVEYYYTPLNPLHTVEVLINEKVRKHGQDSVILYGDEYVLRAKIMDIRGSWKIKMTKSESTSVDYEFTITLRGDDVISGTFLDSRGYHGFWETKLNATGNIITITYSNWEDYVLSGDYFSMSGSFTGGGTEGKWSSEKVE